MITQVSATDFASKHPELHHYTNFDGLSGIHNTQTLWATNYTHLNDTKELAMLEQPLVAALTNRFRLLLIRQKKTNPKVRRAIEDTGGGIANIAADMARHLINSFYAAALNNPSPLVPYFTSFCTHANDPYASEHGLLSQWRGYAGGGGYCIVFNTASLIDLVTREYEAHYWVMPLKLGSVHYLTANFSVEGVFARLLDEAEAIVSAIMNGRPPPEIAIAYFLEAVSFVKHQGFREENEARIVTIPGTQHDLDGVIAEHGNIDVPPFKAIRSRGTRQYIVLFESLKAALPIKRVIVGPSAHSDAAFANARALFGSGITITRCDTPFI